MQNFVFKTATFLLTESKFQFDNLIFTIIFCYIDSISGRLMEHYADGETYCVEVVGGGAVEGVGQEHVG